MSFSSLEYFQYNFKWLIWNTVNLKWFSSKQWLSLDYSKLLYHKCLLLKNLSTMGFCTPLAIFSAAWVKQPWCIPSHYACCLQLWKSWGRRQMFVHWKVLAKTSFINYQWVWKTALFEMYYPYDYISFKNCLDWLVSFERKLICQIGMCFCYCISMLPTITRVFQWNMCPSSTHFQTSPVICNLWIRTPYTKLSILQYV